MDITVIITKIKNIMEEWFALKENVPTKTSDLINDNDFITNSDSRLSDARIPTSHDHGQIANDGKITREAVTAESTDKIIITDASDSHRIKRTNKLLADHIKDATAHSNINSSANATQDTINTAIDSALGIVKNSLDDKIDTNLTYATATGNNDQILCKTYDDSKIHTTQAILSNWVKNPIALVGTGGIGSAGGDAQLTINTKINNALVNLTSNKEDKSNKITSISSSSTDTQYPSAKCVFNNFATKEEVIEKINYGNVDTSQGMRGHIAAFYLFDYLYYGIKIDLEIAYGGDVNYNQLYAHFGDIFTYDDGVIDTNSLTIIKPNNVNVSLYSMGSDGYGITISHTGTVPSSGIAKVMIYKVVPLFYNF